MKRSDFIASIPMLSAIPFIGRNIEQTEAGIFIEKPVPLLPITNVPHLTDFRQLDVRLLLKDVEIGRAYITEIKFFNEDIETTCKDNAGARTFMRADQRITFSAEVFDFNTNCFYTT
jgi:hypothetical protein